MASKSGRMVYNSMQFANLINKDQPVASVYMNRMVKKGLATPLLKGRISFSENDLVIASQLVEPSYISLHSALLFHNIIQQVPKNIQSVTTINSVTYGHLGLEYHKMASRSLMLPLPWNFLSIGANSLKLFVFPNSLISDFENMLR